MSLDSRLTQRGSALVVSLILMMVMTLIGLTAMQGTTLQQSMATNMRDRNLAFEAAEAALRDGEVWLRQQFLASGRPVSASTGTPNVWTRRTAERVNGLANDPVPFTQWTETQWQARARDYPIGSGETLNGVAQQPLIVIEEWQFVPDTVSGQAFALQQGFQNYRITTRAVGGSPNAVVVLQTLVRQRVN